MKVAASTVWEILHDAGSTRRLSAVRHVGRFPALPGRGPAGRRIRIPGATADPTASWAAQAVRNLVMDLEDVGCGARFLIWNQPHLLHALREFEHFYNEHRPHQGITKTRSHQPLPEPLADPDRIACLTTT